MGAVEVRTGRSSLACLGRGCCLFDPSLCAGEPGETATMYNLLNYSTWHKDSKIGWILSYQKASI